MMQSTIQAKAPRFELFEDVRLFWNEQQLATRIVRRWLDWDDDCWWYEVAGNSSHVPETVLGVRHADD
ncbi:MAG: hypothetical protein ACFCVD_02150 [Nodosilinea sp.]